MASCLGTMVPLFVMFLVLFGFVLMNWWITPQSSVLEEVIPLVQSPLIPTSMKHLDGAKLSSELQGVVDVPLKTLLPRVELEYLLSPCAAMGVSSVRDMLRLNRLALRDVGMGPKEQRIFTRALERRVQLRSKIHEVIFGAAGVISKRRRSSRRELSRPPSMMMHGL